MRSRSSWGRRMHLMMSPLEFINRKRIEAVRAALSATD
jgi:hypothetical protein